ncbi:MAG: HDIG domain-containing protein, partial [Bacillota bacterium]|nr:HDIG domain-containing protein [Bacillota bacterium]
DRSGLYEALLGEDYSSDAVAIFDNLPSERLYQLETIFRSYLEQLYASGIKESEMEDFTEKFRQQIADSEVGDDEKQVLNIYLNAAKMEANNVYDKAATQTILDAKLSEVKPVEVTVRPGQIVVQKGTSVTEEQVEMLNKTGLAEHDKNFLYYPGILLYVLCLYFLIYIYCRRFSPYYAYDNHGIHFLGTFLVGFFVICQAIMVITYSMNGTLYSVLGYLLPLPALAIVLTTMINQRFSYFLVVIVSMFMAVMTLNQPSYLIVALVSSLFTVHMVGRVRERYQLVSFGLYIGIINMVLILCMGFIGGQNTTTLLIASVVGLASGFFSSLLALGVIPIAENKFNMSTPMKLMELSNPGHPLIKRLMTEAPGTYYHSVLVGNLAEAAADAIGADSLLVRAASYFHDIGKLERPQYFVENQEPNMNPHEKLTPSLSALIIISHVKDGVEMAEAYDLPQAIVDIINEHHGNSVVRYFYHKAQETAESIDDVPKEAFSYPNPRPQTRESAIVMMADSVQAALQSHNIRSKGDMEARIHDIIHAQLNDGQFEECDLTFRDLHKIQEAFVNVLSGLSHYRIAYPSLSSKGKKILVDKLKKKMGDSNGGISFLMDEALVCKMPPEEETAEIHEDDETLPSSDDSTTKKD